MKLPSLLLALTLCLATPALPAPAASASGLDLSGLDRSVRPQDDLFRFASGTWINQTVIPPDQSSYGSFVRLDEAANAEVQALLRAAVKAHARPGSPRRKVADYYDTFMDTGTIERLGLAPLAAQLARIEAIDTLGEVAAYMGYNQTIGVGAPLLWYVQQDLRDATAYITYVEQSGLTLPDRDYYLRPEPKYVEYRAQLGAYVTDLLALAGQADAAAQSAGIVALEGRLAAAQWSRVQNRDPVASYNKLSLAQASALAPAIDWTRFFTALGAPVNTFIISQPSYVQALGAALAELPVEQWRIYFRYRLLDAYAPDLPARFADRHFEFHQHVLSGVAEQKPRAKRAAIAVNEALGEAVGELYVAQHFTARSRERMVALVGNLLRAYAQSIDTLDWMGPQTRAHAQEKLAAISVKIGYPDAWRDYSALQVRSGDLIGNVIRAEQFDHQRLVRRLGAPVNRREWNMTPQTVNAYYNPLLNEIVFPAAILQPPFYNPAADDAVNYGAIGAVIGHEISHAFDDQGRQFDALGNLRDWWTEEDAARFKARTDALIAQFAQYKVLDGEAVNGELTLGENIADLSGLTIAQRAYRIALEGHGPPPLDGFSADQRFFLGWAQVWRIKYRDDNLRRRLSTDAHSPNPFRANGPVSNIDAFYSAFGLQPGDALYRPPEARVRIW